MGIITPTDLIPDYELIIKDKSPNNKTVWRFWRETFANNEVKTPLQQIFSKFDYIYCLIRKVTGYVNSVTEILSDNPSYCIISHEKDKSSISRSWGMVLNEVLSKGCNSPEEVKRVSEMHNCKLEELNVHTTSKSQQKAHIININNLIRRSIQNPTDFGDVKMSQADEIRK